MGVDLTQTTLMQLWLLVIKRLVYLLAKVISFKGLAFVIACLFVRDGTISGVVWCGMILGIITNRTGGRVADRYLNRTGENDEPMEGELYYDNKKTAADYTAYGSSRHGGTLSAHSAGDSTYHTAHTASRSAAARGKQKLHELMAQAASAESAD